MTTMIPRQVSRWSVVLGLLAGTSLMAETIQVTDPIAANATWTRNNTYVLNGTIYVLQGASLTIEAGTVIKAKPGQDANTSALIVTAGAKIFANGSPTAPIIFTAEADDLDDPEDLGIFERGLWGGVVLLGKAVLNTTTDLAGNGATPKYEVFEGLPDREINGQFVNRFGGSDADVEALRKAGFDDGQVAEITAHVALAIFTNLFNHVAGTASDFPPAPRLA